MRIIGAYKNVPIDVEIPAHKIIELKREMNRTLRALLEENVSIKEISECFIDELEELKNDIENYVNNTPYVDRFMFEKMWREKCFQNCFNYLLYLSILFKLKAISKEDSGIYVLPSLPRFIDE